MMFRQELHPHVQDDNARPRSAKTGDEQPCQDVGRVELVTGADAREDEQHHDSCDLYENPGRTPAALTPGA
jgi:hypothetical protein